MSLVESIAEKGVGVISIVRSHIIQCHPFVGHFFFSVGWDDKEDNEEKKKVNEEESEKESRQRGNGSRIHSNGEVDVVHLQA